MHPDLTIAVDRGPTLTSCVVLFIEDGFELSHIQETIAVDVDQMERLSNFLFVDEALEGGHSEDVGGVVEEAIVIRLDPMEHALPFFLREAHIAIVVRQTPIEI